MKNIVLKSEQQKNYEKRILNIQNIIHKTILSTQKYKILDIFGPNELNICITSLENIFSQLNVLLLEIKNNIITNKSDINTRINNIISELIIIFKNFGTESFNDLISILIDNDYVDEYFSDYPMNDKYQIINTYAHPINFKCMIWKNDKSKKNFR
jgi:hypothetical protein